MFNCIGSGTGMALFSPPIVNESNALLLFAGDGQLCNIIPNSAAAVELFVEPPSFMGTLTLHISDEQSEGLRTVFCRVTAADGMITINETTFSVLGNVMYTSSSIMKMIRPRDIMATEW